MKYALYITTIMLTFLLAGMANAQQIRLCTGSESGVYYAAGKEIQSMAGKSIDVQVVESEGTIDNISKTLDTDECDAMIGQPDGVVYLSRQSPAKVKQLRKIASLHREYLHVLCSKESGIGDLSSLSGGDNGNLAIGEPGSGSWLIWQNIIAEDDGYQGVPVTNEGGILALSAVSSGSASCMLVPAGLRNGTVMEADATFGDTVNLVGANDKDFNDATDIDGKKLYTYEYIPSGTYKMSLQRGIFTRVSTISWNAGVYVNMEKVDKNTLQKFVMAVSRAAINIKAEYGK